MKNIKQKFYHIINHYQFLLRKTLLEIKKKTYTSYVYKSNPSISNFNKYFIASIFLLFLYLFYLSIPALYDKNWIQKTIESNLLDEFKINFSTSSEISYEILPSPHFTIKNAKIYNDDMDLPKELSEIKELKVYVYQNNFFNKEKLKIKRISIMNANFNLQKNDFNFLDNLFNNKFSKKKMIIKKSNIFFKDNDNEIVAIFKISKGSLFYDSEDLSNAILFKGEAFNVPFNFKMIKDPSVTGNTITEIKAKKLKIKFINKSKKISTEVTKGINQLFFKETKLKTNYEKQKNVFTFESKYSQLKNSNIDYLGKLILAPFSLKLDINVDEIKFKPFLKNESTFLEFFKNKFMFNKNLSVNISVSSKENSYNKVFNKAKVVLNINNGEINLNNSSLVNNKFGALKVLDSKLLLEQENLILEANLNLNIEDLNGFYSTFLAPKKLRRPIKNLFIGIKYNFFDDSLIINSFRIDNSKQNNEIKNILNSFNNSGINSTKNFINKRSLLIQLLSAYAG